MSKTFLVMGSTGSTGSKTVKFLLDRGDRVRAFVHSEDERSAALAAQGAEIVRGDLLDFEAVRAALEGAQFCLPHQAWHPRGLGLFRSGSEGGWHRDRCEHAPDFGAPGSEKSRGPGSLDFGADL